MDEYYQLSEVSELTGNRLPVQTLAKLARLQKLPARKFAGVWLVLKADFPGWWEAYQTSQPHRPGIKAGSKWSENRRKAHESR